MRIKFIFGSGKDRLPIILIDLYVMGALFLYIFGPIRFRKDNTWGLSAYIVLFLISINLTYFIALYNTKQKNDYNGNDVLSRTRIPLPFWFQFLGFVIPAFMVLSSIIMTRSISMESGVFNAMAQTYTFVQSGGVIVSGIDIPMWIYMHFGVFVYLSIVDSIIFYKKLNLFRQLIFWGTLISLLVYFIFFKGTQKTLGDVFVLVASAFLVKQFLYTKEKKNIKKRTIVLLVVFAAIFAYVLSSIMGARIAYLASVGYDGFKLETPFYKVDLSSPLLQIFADSSKLGISCLIFYLCNGLYGLSLCLKTGFEWSYGIGSMMDFTGIIERRFGIESISKSTFMYRTYMETGWHYNEQWHTIFPWLASDYTFFGAIILLCCVTYIYAVCWQEIINGKSKASIFLFSILNIMWIYLPANNQIFSTRTTTVIFIFCFLTWIVRGKNVKRKKIKFQRKLQKNVLHFSIYAKRRKI